MRPVTPFMTILTTSVGSLPMTTTLNEVIWAGQPGAGRRPADRSAPLNVPVHPERARGSRPAQAAAVRVGHDWRMPLFAFEGHEPRVSATAWIAPTATLI